MASGPFDLGAQTPKDIAQGARDALLRDSERNIREEQVTNADGPEAREPSPATSEFIVAIEPPGLEISRYNPAGKTTSAIAGIAAQSRAQLESKIKAAEALCAAFDSTAAKFANTPSARFAKDLAKRFTELCESLVNGPPNGRTNNYTEQPKAQPHLGQQSGGACSRTH
ncbi:hypothetical protein CEP54_016207 [Fusarium duplospermum]|uniref:Uncharacterized protein n=1 Tax=Fusarium duplospermum TaxID=1325734 RepID=A0A428NGV2_9HYPO|nr:hypothetical protein CEP54_016207 [Fusarium duplospermum]